MPGPATSGSSVNASGPTVMQPVAFDTYNQTASATAQTLCSRGDTPGGSAHLVPAVWQAMQVRRLTPVECERLQGFPDGYTAIPIVKRQPIKGQPAVVKAAADGPRYKALGNSWAVPCVRWIGRRIHNAVVGRPA
jgi:DNA (cytosine-5)-methyltransferase 1